MRTPSQRACYTNPPRWRPSQHIRSCTGIEESRVSHRQRRPPFPDACSTAPQESSTPSALSRVSQRRPLLLKALPSRMRPHQPSKPRTSLSLHKSLRASSMSRDHQSGCQRKMGDHALPCLARLRGHSPVVPSRPRTALPTARTMCRSVLRAGHPQC